MEEWRGTLKGEVFQPHAIIFRVSGSDGSGKEPVKKTCLVVAALAADGSAKLIGSAMGKDENEKAVALADKSRSKQP